jgi:hypothetical protein
MPSGGFETASGSSSGPPFCAIFRRFGKCWPLSFLATHATYSSSMSHCRTRSILGLVVNQLAWTGRRVDGPAQDSGVERALWLFVLDF